MPRIAYFDCFSGISGDMTIAAFLDAGLKFEKLSSGLARLKLKGYKLKKSKTRRGGISGTKFDCVVDRKAGYRALDEILALIRRSALSRRAGNIACAIFENIGRAEMKVHGLTKRSSLHLHELGDIDSIIDIVGTGIAVDELGIDAIYSSHVSMGRSFVDSRHGRIPVPSPATLELLKSVPAAIFEIDAELVTPTGAGILKTLVKGFGRMPRMEIDKIGYGAGSKIIAERPNMLRVIIGSPEPAFLEDRITVIETNIDDMNPQGFEYIFERLFKEGALDVYATPIQMKKTRPALLLTALARPEDVSRIASVIFSETTTIGLRIYEADRLKLDRKLTKVNTKYGAVNVKVALGPGGISKASPEYDDCVKIARIKNVSFKAVYDEASRHAKV